MNPAKVMNCSQLGQIASLLLIPLGVANASTGYTTTANVSVDTHSVMLTLTTAQDGVTGAGGYAKNATATVTATATAGYLFTGWTGDASGTTNPLLVLMDTNKAIGAIYLADTSDTDGDGLSNYDEAVTYGTDPTLRDSDGDGLTDAWEAGLGRFSVIAGLFTWAQARADAHARGGELACFPIAARWAKAMESLGTGATDNFVGLWIGASDAAAEGVWTWVNSDPFAFTNWATSRPSAATGNTLDYAEVSGGGGAEIEKWYDRTASFVRDGYILEVGYATDPTISDSDGDWLSDGVEVNLTHTNPKLGDSNGNGINDGQEDSDGDGFSNLFEVSNGFNPGLASSTPDLLAWIKLVPLSSPTPVQFRFNAANGGSYRIEGSTDLNEWSMIETGITGTGGGVTRFYSIEKIPQRYFRARRN